MFEEDILVHLENDWGYLAVKTYDRKHGGRGRFLFSADMVQKAMKEQDNAVHYDKDCSDYAEFKCDGEYVKFRFLWINTKPDLTVEGFQQFIAIPIDVVQCALYDRTPMRSLCRNPKGKAHIEHRSAGRTIRHLLDDKRKRRAFSKAMRDCFQWAGDTVTLYPDGGDNFFFTTQSGFPKNGGLILHEATFNGYPKQYYSIHT